VQPSPSGVVFFFVNTPPSGVFLFYNMKGEILQQVTNRQRLHASIQGIIDEAHIDDRKMPGIAVALANRGVGIRVVTHTDSAARVLDTYTSDELAIARWYESINHGKIIKAAEVRRGKIPDGEMLGNLPEAILFLREAASERIPDFIIAPHWLDPHPDHQAAYLTARAVAGDSIPFYVSDTISGVDKNGDLVVPTHYIRLSRRCAGREIKGYDANKSQTENLPPQDMEDVQAVRNMTSRRGREIGVSHATVLVKINNGSSDDPIAEILGKDVILV